MTQLAGADVVVGSTSGGGGAVSSVTAADTTLTITPTTGAVTAKIPSSVALPGAPTTTTPATADSTTKIATTAMVQAAIAAAAIGTPVTPQNGGTGVANGSANTVTLSGNFGLTLTLSATTALTLPTSGTVTALGNATTGSGSIVLATSPTLVTPTLGAATATTINKVTITAPATAATITVSDGKTLAVSNSLTFAGTDGQTFTFPNGSDTVVTLGATQTLTAKTLTAPVMTAPAITGVGTADIFRYNLDTVTVASNAGTCSAAFRLSKFTNSSAATMTITIATSGATDGQEKIVQIRDASAVAQTISWVNTENSTVTVPGTSNGSTTLPLTATFLFNASTTKWRCVGVA